MKISTSKEVANGNESPKTGIFANRFVEFDAVNIGTAVIAIGAYMLDVPLIPISLGVGCVIIGKRLFARSVVDPITDNLEKIKSSNPNERMESLLVLSEAYNKASPDKQILILKAMMGMLSNEVDAESSKQIGEKINRLIQAGEFNNDDKLKVYVAECTTFFEKVANEATEKNISESLFQAIKLLHTIIVTQKINILSKTRIIDWVKLHESLNNLIIDVKSTDALVAEITKALPLSLEQNINFSLKSIESRNANTSYAALKHLDSLYGVVSDGKIEMIKAMMRLLNDTNNKPDALEKIKLWVRNKKLDDAEKLKAFIEGCSIYIKNPGEIDWQSRSQKNSNRFVLAGMIDVFLEFLENYTNDINDKKIDLNSLIQSLKELIIPDDPYSDCKERLERVCQAFININK